MCVQRLFLFFEKRKAKHEHTTFLFLYFFLSSSFSTIDTKYETKSSFFFDAGTVVWWRPCSTDAQNNEVSIVEVKESHVKINETTSWSTAPYRSHRNMKRYSVRVFSDGVIGADDRTDFRSPLILRCCVQRPAVGWRWLWLIIIVFER